MKFGCVNVCGLTHTNACELTDALQRLSIDVMGVTETWEGRCQPQSLPGYTYIGKPRLGGQGGGVGFYVSRTIAPLTKAFNDTALPESLWLEINTHRNNARPVYVGLVYIPPSALTSSESAHNAYTALQTDIQRFQEMGTTLVMGDFNSRVGSASAPGAHMGEWGEDIQMDIAGNAMLRMLEETNLYTLNNRVAHPEPDTHTPQYTRRRIVQTPTGPTEQRSILDYVLMPPTYVFTESPTVQPPCSLVIETGTRLTGADHLLMWFTLPHPVQKKSPPYFQQPRPNTHKLTLPLSALTHEEKAQREAYPIAIQTHFSDFPELLAQLQEDATQGTLTPQVVCEKAKQLACDRIYAAVDSTIGYKIPRRHPVRQTPPVRTREVKQAVAMRDAAADALAALDNTNNAATPEVTAARNSLKTAQTTLRATVKHARERHLTNLIQRVYSCRVANDGKGMWAGLKALAGSTKSNVGPSALKDPSGPGLLTGDQEICETLANHYERVSTSTAHYAGAPFDAQHRTYIEEEVREFRQHLSFNSEAPEELIADINRAEVATQAFKLNNNKAPSPLDNINNELLKYGGTAMHTAMAALFNLQFTLETKAKTCGVITPLYKKSDPTEPENYRPITLGSALDKLYNLVLNARIMQYLENNNKLHDAQQGFRPGRSAVDNIFMLKTCLDARVHEKKDTYLLFVDIAKAYDTVWREGLLWHLWQMGITGKMFRVLAQMLDDAPSVVMHNGAFSRVMEPDMGWEQGDTLATTMFNIYIDSVLQHVWATHEGVPVPGNDERPPAKLTALMYADDMVGVADSPVAVQTLADRTREALSKWQLKASVNPTDSSKTAIMVIKGGPKSARQFAARHATNNPHMYRWGDVAIPQVQSYRYLGVWLNSTNTWDDHFAQRLKCAQAVAATHHKVLTNVRLPMDIRKLTLTTVIQPVVTYAAQAWARPNAQLRQKLDSWQMAIATRAMHCPPNASHICLQQELGLCPLHVTCDTLALRYWHHLQNTPSDRLLHQINTAWTGKAHPWAASMERLLQQYDIDGAQTTSLTKAKFKDYVDKKAVDYLRTYWTEPPRRYRGAVHARYVSSYGVGQLTTLRPKLRKYIAEDFKTSSISETAKGVELCMHMRLECLGLNAFHCHRRHGETHDAQHHRQLCPCCQQAPETPTHFLLECPAYSSPRSLLLADAIADAQGAAMIVPAPAAPGDPAPEGPNHDGPAPSGLGPNSPAPGGPAPLWRVILARIQPGVIKFVQDAWFVRRAVLTGRGANGGNPMALPPVP
jgi:hypothetical protein